MLAAEMCLIFWHGRIWFHLLFVNRVCVCAHFFELATAQDFLVGKRGRIGNVFAGLDLIDASFGL